MNIGAKIGEGGCSEVYELGDGRVLKLAKPNTDYGAMKKEFINNRLAYDLGLPVARPHEIVTIDDRTGIIFDRIYGEPLKDELFSGLINNSQDHHKAELILEKNALITARTLSKIHSHSNVDNPYKQIDVLKYLINLPEYLTQEEKEEILAILDALPKKYCFCHGDPNPGNIMINNEGDPVVIDWLDGTIGNPEADLAEYIVMIRYAVLPPELPPEATVFFDKHRETLVDIFMSEYSRLTGVTYDDVKPWFVPISARKLSADAIQPAEKELLVREIRKALGA